MVYGLGLAFISHRDSLELFEEEREGGNFKGDIQARFARSCRLFAPPSRPRVLPQAFFKSSTVFNLLPLSGRIVIVDSRCRQVLHGGVCARA